MSQPEQPTFFMDENLLGKHLVQALRETRISANGKVSKWLDRNRLLKTLRQYGPEPLG